MEFWIPWSIVDPPLHLSLERLPSILARRGMNLFKNELVDFTFFHGVQWTFSRWMFPSTLQEKYSHSLFQFHMLLFYLQCVYVCTYGMHSSHMVWKSSFDISLFPTMFNNSRESYRKAWRRIIFKMSLSRFKWPNLCSVYLKCSAQSSILLSFFYMNLKVSSLISSDLK